MGHLVEGEWREEGDRTARTGGAFERPATTLRRWITAGGSSGFPAAAGRYHLFLALACPWCHRTLLLRLLKRLQSVVSVSFVEPLMLENGWTFASPDPITGARYAYEIYQRADPRYSGRASVPILWDKETRTIVSNESADIIRMLNTAFAAFTDDRNDYYPPAMRPEIDALNQRIYDTVNNGVYKAGFASAQAAHAAAVTALFDYARALYQQPGVAATVDLENFKTHYYGSQRRVNPSGVVPLGPRIDFSLRSRRA
jgi:putative glutathione S-transferase